MARRYIPSEPTSRLAIWARRMAGFAFLASFLAVLIVRSGLLENRPALATFAGALATAVVALLRSEPVGAAQPGPVCSFGKDRPMARRYIPSEPTSRLAIWARRMAGFAFLASFLAVLIVRSGLLENRPALATFAGALATAVVALL